MPHPEPDYSIVERRWEERLRERGLSPDRFDFGVANLYGRLHLLRGPVSMAAFDLKAPVVRSSWTASVEVKLRMDLGGRNREFDICDVVVHSAPTAEDALRRCADDVLAVTYPPVEALCTGRVADGPGTTEGEIETRLNTGQIARWITFAGPVGVHDDSAITATASTALAELRQRPPIVSVFEAVTKHLVAPRLHWCRIAGRALDCAFFCSFDNEDASDLVAAIATKFRTDVTSDWRFRQLAVFVPLTR